MDEVGQLKCQFAEVYPDSEPPAVCQAPGRVNLIGEHTDYNGLPVLPMAMDLGIRVAFAPRADGRVRLANVDQAFPAREFANGPAIAPSRTGAWDNYCKAAIQGLNDHFGRTDHPGMDLLMAGAIPIAAGLSSSSALVVACALAYLRVLGVRLDEDVSRLALAGVLAEAEHYVGTRGGGMDQAIILAGLEGRALKIDFFPLRTEEVPAPPDHDIIVCNSLVRVEKTGDAMDRYNEGPRLCGLICALTEKQVQRDFGDEIELARLGDLWHGHLCLTHDEVRRLFARVAPNATTTLAEAARVLEVSPETIRERWLGDLPEPDHGFPLRARMRHQLTEYQRVEAARDAMLTGNAVELGRLMNASHDSCARDYQVSCRELDCLVAAAREAGAIGARLTGAGLGGCTVNLVPTPLREAFFAQVEQGYYREYLAKPPERQPAQSMFVASASAGAGYLD